MEYRVGESLAECLAREIRLREQRISRARPIAVARAAEPSVYRESGDAVSRAASASWVNLEVASHGTMALLDS
jgi:hypothetical protein